MNKPFCVCLFTSHPAALLLRKQDDREAEVINDILGRPLLGCSHSLFSMKYVSCTEETARLPAKAWILTVIDLTKEMKTYYEIIFEPICCTLSPVKANCVLNLCKLIHGIENPCVALEGSFKLRPSLPFTQWKIRYNVIFTLCHVVFLIPDVSFNPLIFK